MRIPSVTVCLLVTVLMTMPARALLFWNQDNSANTSDPLTGVPWGSVAAVSNGTGSLRSGSAVYLGNGYLLTANHVTMNAIYDFVTFNGVSFFQIDSTFQSGSRTAGKQVDTGLDMAVFKLQTIPGGIPAVTLLGTGTEEIAPATIVGWGVGRDPADPLGDAVVTWGAESTTSAKRWGENVPLDLVNLSDGSYSYTAVRTVAGGSGPGYNPEGVGNNEAAVTLLDSGSGLFQNISGSWYLIGLTNTVSFQSGSFTTTFGNDKTTGSTGDDNYFTQISAYDDKILALIPEPSAAQFVLFFAGALLIFRARGSLGKLRILCARS
ncbi:MAG: hypothetical protein ACOYM3_00875 [Terrimicrobiaceae bacterium]